MGPPYLAEFGLSIVLCGVVLPAWWKFILPTIVAIDIELEEEREAEHAEPSALKLSRQLSDESLKRSLRAKVASLQKVCDEKQRALDTYFSAAEDRANTVKELEGRKRQLRA